MKSLLLLALLSAAPAAFAQEATVPTPTPNSKLYVTLQTAYLSYPPGRDIFEGSPGVSQFFPVSVSAGYWLGGKTIQGKAAQLLGIEFNYTAQFPTTKTYEKDDYRISSRTSAKAFTLLERMVIPPLSASGRWGAEGALGIIWYVANQKNTSYLRSTGAASGGWSRSYSKAQFLASVSPFYQLTPHWQLVSDLRLHMTAILAADGPQVGGGVAVGTRYYL